MRRAFSCVDPLMQREEDDVSSDCSSGCQSGWTDYLDKSCGECRQPLVCGKGGSFEEEEEDLSMVSDASSGPPHFPEEDEHSCGYLRSSTCFQAGGCLCSALTPAAGLAAGGAKKRRVEPEQQRQRSSLLDDTASSPLFSFSKRNLQLEKQMGHLQSSVPVKPTPWRPISRKVGGKKIW
ncbi:protein SOB FIVE-LIKE 5-like isoform X2 [Musa acuminata AAA Group]|uniref:protein SOB FIVE-LIKE 5-like isoform X2 n=1 Tax=Musa acuminata AAA Group TaxID=214697 RepID=UPI0031E0BBD1